MKPVAPKKLAGDVVEELGRWGLASLLGAGGYAAEESERVLWNAAQEHDAERADRNRVHEQR
jgi:hypothetical protein